MQGISVNIAKALKLYGRSHNHCAIQDRISGNGRVHLGDRHIANQEKTQYKHNMILSIAHIYCKAIVFQNTPQIFQAPRLCCYKSHLLQGNHRMLPFYS